MEKYAEFIRNTSPVKVNFLWASVWALSKKIPRVVEINHIAYVKMKKIGNPIRMSFSAIEKRSRIP